MVKALDKSGADCLEHRIKLSENLVYTYDFNNNNNDM